MDDVLCSFWNEMRALGMTKFPLATGVVGVLSLLAFSDPSLTEEGEKEMDIELAFETKSSF